jgi:hypothetical protein
MFMFASMNDVLKEIDVSAYRLYRDRLLADYGNPGDPIVILLVEQVALAHLNTGRLFYKASTAGSVECATAYLAAISRLMGEIRRTSLALPAYREAALRVERQAHGSEWSPGKVTCDSEIEDGEDAHAPVETRSPGRGTRITGRATRTAAASNAR